MPSPSAPTYPRLLGDVGGTHARFAWLAGPDAAITDVVSLPSAAHASLRDAIEHYLRMHPHWPRPRWCGIGIAMPVSGDVVSMTNHDWSFSISQLRTELGVERLLVINDFTALALTLPTLQASELEPVGDGRPVAGAAVGLIGPGTGLGVSGLVPVARTGAMAALRGEGGHVTLAATTEREEAVIATLRRRFGHVSAERAVSGPGLVNLHDALCILAGTDEAAVPPRTPEEVTAHAAAGTDPHCVEAVDLFYAFLGTAAGNLALTLGAYGGVYIGGGVVPRLGDSIHRSRLRERFEGKGRFRQALAQVPIWVIRAHVSPALAGAARALEML